MRTARGRRRRIAVVLAGATVLGLTVCTGAPADRTAAVPTNCAPPVEPGTARISGALHFVMTIGAVTADDSSWAMSYPRAGVVEVFGVSGRRRTLRPDGDGGFGLVVPPGRYRVTGFIPGVHEQDYSDEPVIRTSHTVTVGPGECANLRLLIYQWLP
jgi:hypothetical protein